MKTEKINYFCYLIHKILNLGDLFTTDTFSGESACSEIINLNGITTSNVIPLADDQILCSKMVI